MAKSSSNASGLRAYPAVTMRPVRQGERGGAVAAAFEIDRDRAVPAAEGGVEAAVGVVAGHQGIGAFIPAISGDQESPVCLHGEVVRAGAESSEVACDDAVPAAEARIQRAVRVIATPKSRLG